MNIFLIIISIILFYCSINSLKSNNNINFQYVGISSLYILYFFILGMVNLFITSVNNYFIFICFLLSLILFILLGLKNIIDKEKLKIYLIKIIKLISISFLILLVFYLNKNYYNLILNWDDFSYWMRIYKIYSLNGLNLEIISNLTIWQGYVTKLTLGYPAIHSFVASILFPYPIYEPFIVYCLLTLFLSFILFDFFIFLNISSEHRPIVLLIILIVFSASTPLNHNHQVDILLPLIMILGIIQSKNCNYKLNIILSIIIFSFAIFLKPPTALALLFIYFIYLVLKKKINLISLIILIIPVLFFAIYILHYSTFINLEYKPSPQFSNIVVLFTNIQSNFVNIFYAEFLYPLINLSPSKSLANLMGIIVISIYFYKNKNLSSFIFVLTSFLVYILYLSISYSTFVLDSTNRFASFDRYFFTFYIFILFYYLVDFFSEKQLNNYLYFIYLLFFNTCYFFPKLLFILPLYIIALKFGILIISKKIKLFNYLILIIFFISLFFIKNKIYPPEYMVLNGNFLINLSNLKTNNKIIIIDVCNPTGYDYLAIDYYFDFYKNYIINSKECNGLEKYSLN
jgi:hypothetical protein